MYSSARCCNGCATTLLLAAKSLIVQRLAQTEQLSIIHNTSQCCTLECTAIQLGRCVRQIGPSQVDAVCT